MGGGAQLYENVRATYVHFFETLPKQQPLPPLQFSSSLCSFKVLAETPLQGGASSPMNTNDSRPDALMTASCASRSWAAAVQLLILSLASCAHIIERNIWPWKSSGKLPGPSCWIHLVPYLI